MDLFGRPLADIDRHQPPVDIGQIDDSKSNNTSTKTTKNKDKKKISTTTKKHNKENTNPFPIDEKMKQHHDEVEGTALSFMLSRNRDLIGAAQDMAEHASVHRTVLSADDSSTVSAELGMSTNQTRLFSTLVCAVGLVAAAFFIGYGILGENAEQKAKFHLRAEETALEFRTAFEDYVAASKWVYQACAYHPITGEDFAVISDYARSDINIEVVAWVPRVNHSDRQAIENETKDLFANYYPHVPFNYTGFTQVTSPTTEPGTLPGLENRSDADIYYPLHFFSPVGPASLRFADADLYTSLLHRDIIDRAMLKHEAAMSKHTLPSADGRARNTSDTSKDTIILMHPGVGTGDDADGQEPAGVSMLVTLMRDFIAHGSRHLQEGIQLYMYNELENDEIAFMAGVQLRLKEDIDDDNRPLHDHSSNVIPTYLDATTYDNLTETTGAGLKAEFTIEVLTGTWRLVFVPLEGTFEATLRTIFIAGAFIAAACICIAFWLGNEISKSKSLTEVKRKAEAEKAALMVRNAQETAKVERELNDYIAHEVRNPLAAALSACYFVKSAVNEEKPMASEQLVTSVREDVQIIDNSLTFMNDLLRSMLDMHKAASNKIRLDFVAVDVMNDVLQPVAAMLYQRGSRFRILTECPDNLIVMTDGLRLKQVVLNLGRNSTKFVEVGFIKLKAEVLDGSVRVLVEDSGPGIPHSKRKHLFSKFQESLDRLEQGTGMGLCLCKNMVTLLGGEIQHDESFDSRIPGCPGTRFVINLNTSPLSNEEYEQLVHEYKDKDGDDINKEPEQVKEKIEDIPPSIDTTQLPENLSVLFVDDDLVLRKLFSRSVRKVASTWKIKEAANGESALEMAEAETFDLIFLDQYMASVQKQLLGTETARALRSKGVTSRICGLSANDVEQGFLDAGADFFMFKPFPCQTEALRVELARIIHGCRHPAVEATLASQAGTASTSHPGSDTASVSTH